jgi:hypothetical protein
MNCLLLAMSEGREVLVDEVIGDTTGHAVEGDDYDTWERKYLKLIDLKTSEIRRLQFQLAQMAQVKRTRVLGDDETDLMTISFGRLQAAIRMLKQLKQQLANGQYRAMELGIGA